MTNTITGTGIFTWDGRERRSDRYGVFALDKTDDAGWSANPQAFDTERCHITVEVLETRESGHIGDFFRGIFPERPADDRDSDWFDPRKLYRLHDQTVRVTIATETDRT